MIVAAEVYKVLRDDIIRGRLNPGERIIEKDVCERLGTTRGYVRDALKMLEADGFCHLNHGKGATVVKISYQEMKNLYEILAILESKSIELAVPHLTQSDIDQLMEINSAMKECVHIEDRSNARRIWQEENFKFHKIIAGKSGNQELTDLVENIRWRTFDFRYVFIFEPYFKFFTDQHDHLIKTLQKKTAAEAKDVMEDHVTRASEVVLSYLESPSL